MSPGAVTPCRKMRYALSTWCAAPPIAVRSIEPFPAAEASDEGPLPRRTRPIRHTRRSLRQARPDRHRAGLEQEGRLIVAGAEEEFCAGALEIRAGAWRARCGRPADQHRARRAAQSHPL